MRHTIRLQDRPHARWRGMLVQGCTVIHRGQQLHRRGFWSVTGCHDVEPSLFRWASERSRLTPDELAFSSPKLPEWEIDEGHWTLNQVDQPDSGSPDGLNMAG